METERARMIDAILQNVACMHERPQIGPWSPWLNLDLTLPQVKVLIVLWGREPMRMSELSQMIGTNLSSLTGIVDRLVERDLVERRSDLEDRRIVLVQLSEAGRSQVSQIISFGQARIGALLERVETSNLRVINQAMQILQQAWADVSSVSEAHAPQHVLAEQEHQSAVGEVAGSLGA